ncbi:Ethanolaminephosphotransferase 1 [Blattella germanica]|nr:Ethanolaminephosphotransferase 1 [Blattella germanica]
MHPFWNRVVEWCPKWIAPNLLTFAGFLFTVLNFIMFSYYDYYFEASSDSSDVLPIPRWVWAVAAINIFLAYTLDGIDGKQARRTQTSGPLGELFDHGLDSWTAFLIPTCMYSVFGRAEHSISPLRMYFCLWNVFINFYLSHWEKYNTGVLFLPWGYDASMVWKVLKNSDKIISELYADNLSDVSSYELSDNEEGADSLSTPSSSSRVGSTRVPSSESDSDNETCDEATNRGSYRDGTGKMRSFSEAMRPLVPCTVFLVICTVWVVYSPNNVVNLDPRCVYLVTGTIFSNICVRQMCRHFRISCFRIRQHGE